jgi:transposase
MVGGRPTKLTPETQKKIVDAIRLGAKYKIAAAYGGISYDAFNEWMVKGEQATSGQYSQFRHAVKEAEGAAAVGWLAKIEKAASEGTWTAAAWKLERIYPDEYAMTQKHRHAGDDSAPPIETHNRTEVQIVDADAYNREFAALLGVGDGTSDGDGDVPPQSRLHAAPADDEAGALPRP